jgi:CHASE3 domain sensor protein
MPRSTALGSTDWVIWLGLAAAIIFFLATGAVAYFNFQTLKADSALVIHTGDTLTALDDVLSMVKDAETGQRGYLLTGKDSYLDPYNAAVQEIGPGLDALQRLTIDNPTQQDRLGSLKQRIGAKLAELKQTIDLRQNQGQAAALAVVQSDRGKQDMDAIRDQVSAMEKLANALLFAKGTMTRWPAGTSSLFPKGTRLRDALGLVRHVHAPIAKLFGSGVTSC